MPDLVKFASTSNLIRFILKDKTTGQGKTGLTGSTSGLIISTICDNEASATTYTQAAGHIQTIAALGTYAAPSASNCRFGQVDATNHPGLYEFQFADARFAIASSKRLVISVNDAEATILDADYEIQLVQFDPFDAVHLGLSSLPNTAVTTNASLLTSGTGTDQLSVTSGRVDLGKALGTAVTLDSNNVLNVSTKYWAGTTIAATSIPVGTAAGAAGGLFIAGTNAATTITTALTTTFTGNLTGNVGGNVTGTVGGMTAAGMALFFTTNTTKVYADAISGSVVKEIASNAAGSAPTAAVVAAAVWDEVLTGATHNITNSAGKLLRSVAPNSGAIYSGTLPSQVGMTSTQIKFDSGASSSDDAYNNDVVSVLTGTGSGESAIITDYVGSTRVATLDRAWVVQPTATATFEITPLTTVTVGGPVTVGTINTGAITAGSIAADALDGKGDWLTTLGATAPAGWIDATSIAADALDGKGDWSTLTAGQVWLSGSRTLTSGAGIVLTKGLGVTGFNDLDAGGIRAAIGMDIANLDAQLEALPTAAEAADKLLGRNIAGGSDGGRTVAEAMAFLRNKWAISGGTLTVYAANDSTTLWTATVTTTAGNPVTAIDPP